MTRKDYELIAKAIKRSVEGVPSKKGDMVLIRHTVNCIAEEMSIDNPKFNKEKFLAACGLD